MKKYLLISSIAILVACSDDEVINTENSSTNETPKQVANIVEKPVEQPKELTEEEKYDSDYIKGHKHLVMLDEHYNYYIKITEVKRKDAFDSSKTNSLNAAIFADEELEKLKKENSISSLYDKEFESKINMFQDALLDSYEAVRDATYATYQYSKGEVSIDKRSELHNSYVNKHDELQAIRRDAVEYYNSKFKSSE